MRYLRAYFLCKWKKILDNTRLNVYNKDIPRRKEESDGERKNRTCNSGNSVGDCNNTADTSPKKLKEKATRKGSRPFGGIIPHRRTEMEKIIRIAALIITLTALFIVLWRW
nr:MAG TPA: hypothetical protein [Caudoviricetes sp.]